MKRYLLLAVLASMMTLPVWADEIDTPDCLAMTESAPSDNPLPCPTPDESYSTPVTYTQSHLRTLTPPSFSQGVHPYLSLDAGISKYTGEFARLTFTTGGHFGINLSASIGKELFFDSYNKDTTCWNFGAGLFIRNYSNKFSMNMAFGETALYYDYGLLMNLEYERFFGKNRMFGIFGGIGVAICDITDEYGKIYFDFDIGLSVKLWQR